MVKSLTVVTLDFPFFQVRDIYTYVLTYGIIFIKSISWFPRTFMAPWTIENPCRVSCRIEISQWQCFLSLCISQDKKLKVSGPNFPLSREGALSFSCISTGLFVCCSVLLICVPVKFCVPTELIYLMRGNDEGLLPDYESTIGRNIGGEY